MPRITHEHLHEHLLAIDRHLTAIGKDQDRQSEVLRKMQQEQDAQGLILRRTFRKVGKIMTIAEDLTREIQETKDAVGVVATRMQELIDQLNSEGGLSAAAQAAVDGLNEIQTTLATMAAPTT